MNEYDVASETGAGGEIPDLGVSTIPAVLDRAVALYGDREAFVGDGMRLTFTELAAEVDRVAKALLAAGVDTGDRVGIWGPNSLRWLLGALATYRIGATVVPINTRFKGSEAAYVLRTAGARLLLTVTDFLDTNYPALLTDENAVGTLQSIVVMSGEPGTHNSWTGFVEAGQAVADHEVTTRAAAVAPDDLSDIMFTSGTTGQPKGAMLTHAATVRGFDAWATVVGLRDTDRYLIVNPFFHTFGLKAGIVSALIKGATIVPLKMFDVRAAMQLIEDEQISMLPGPPSIYQTMLDHPDVASFDLSSLRLAVTGAAPVSVELVRRMREELHFETVVTGYGLTESTGIITMCRHADPDETISQTSGRAIPGMEVRLVDDDGNDVAVGTPGEVLARGYTIMRGYFANPQATAEAIDADGWLATGDVAVGDELGYIQITDRKKDMFIMGGFNAYPAEIERSLSAYPGVSQVAVIGVADHRMGEVGKAFIVPKPGAQIVADDVISWCRATMANYKVPRFVEVLEAMPMNASGKILKFELRDRTT